MTKYTNTLSTFQLLEMLPTEKSARLYFESKFWGNRPKCPACSNQQINKIYHQPSRAGWYRCKCCHTQFSVRTDTVMHASKIPLRKWLYGMYLIVTHAKGYRAINWLKN